LRFALGGGDSDSPFVGLVMPAGEIAGHDRIAFTAAASRPMRVSVQLRVAEAGGERWQRSVYLDETARGVVVPFEEMRRISSSRLTMKAAATPPRRAVSLMPRTPCPPRPMRLNRSIAGC